MRPSLLAALLPLLPLLASACAQTSEATADDDITSNDAAILDFRFSAEVTAPAQLEARTAILAQLQYTQGMLTTNDRANGHVGHVTLTDVTESVAGDKKTIRYTASLPVAWPKDGRASEASYDIVLPRDASAFDAFNAKYDGSCGISEYGRETFWHDWNPKASGCAIDDADVVRASATVGPHAAETTNKYPEYALAWEDDRLDVVAIFGIIGSNTPTDWGYSEAADFLDHAQSLVTEPAVQEKTLSPSVLRHATVTGKASVGGRLRDVNVDVIIVQELKSVGSDFDALYDPLSERADLVLYNGHAGLGKNVNALARKGQVAPNKYQFVLMNGCQSFAYLDTAINDRRIEANGRASNPNGTRYLDVMANALPGYAHNLASMSNRVLGAFVSADQPQHYNQLLSDMPVDHLVAVFGEEDNQFQP